MTTPNDPARAGQQEGRRIASRFGNRYAVAQIHTRFAGYQWFVLDAEQFDTDLDCYGVVVGQFDDRQAALDRSDQLNREAAMADEFDDLCEPTVDDSTSECYWCGRIVHGSGEDCGGCSERHEGID